MTAIEKTLYWNALYWHPLLDGSVFIREYDQRAGACVERQSGLRCRIGRRGVCVRSCKGRCGVIILGSRIYHCI